jgi:hypothetical protein
MQDVAAQPVSFRDDQRIARADAVDGGEQGGAVLKRKGTTEAGIRERLDDRQAEASSGSFNGRLLRLKPEPGVSLRFRGHAPIADDTAAYSH